MARKDMPQGLRQEYPKRLAEQLARQYGQLDARAMELIDLLLVPAIAANDDVAIHLALSQIGDVLAQEWPDDRIEKIARTAATTQSTNHGKKFYSALGAALGVTVLAASTTNPIPEGVTPSPGASSGMPKPRRARPQFAARVLVGPDLYADEYVRENVKYIGELRKGIVRGLDDAVVRARQFGAPGVRGEGPEELARRLREIWAKNGVPSQLPTTRLKANGEPVMLSTSKHALMVAEDQLAKLHSNIQQSRMEASGIATYTWTTQRDSTVREAHRVLEGRTFSWASGGAPGEGHPGHAPRCRCTATPVLDKDQILASLVPIR